MGKRVLLTLFVGMLIVTFASTVYAQTRLFVDLPSGTVYSDTLESPPPAEVFHIWTEVEDGELTGTGVHPTIAGQDFNDISEELLEVTVTIPEDGEWWLWMHYDYPFARISNFKPSFFVTNEALEFVSAPDATSPDPVPFLDDDVAPFGLWAWDGSAGDDNTINANSMGGFLGNLSAGEYIISIFPRETTEGTGGEDAKPEQNPHIDNALPYQRWRG